jgi:transcription-repair coupling factor (superfamily II helicase)
MTRFIANTIIDAFRASEPFVRLMSALSERRKISVGGLPDSLASVALSALGKEQRLLLISPESSRSEAVLDDLYLLLGESEVCFLPPGGKYRLTRLTPESAEHHRAEALRRLANNPPQCLTLLPGTLTESFPTVSVLKENVLHLRVGMSQDPHKLIRRFMNAGFHREAQVEGCGEIALRGGILDLFPYGHRNPLRLEFWGDEIASLREFEARTQRSVRNLDSAELLIHKETQKTVSPLKLMEGVVVWDNYDEICERYRRLTNSVEEPGDFPTPQQIQIFLQPLEKGDIDFEGRSADIFLGSETGFLKKADSYLEQGFTVILGAESEHRLLKLEEILFDLDKDIASSLKIGVFPLQKGFVFPLQKIACFTERELYDRPRPRRSFARFRTYAHPIEPEALKKGDYVVHHDYGIGIFQGLKKIKVAGHERECLHLKYRDNVSLYVRLESFAKVQKYSGREGFQPALSKIGGVEWRFTRNRAKKALLDIARDLLILQAKREIKGGFSFSPDDVWQKQLEASFQFDDTPDQSKATEEVKMDMESDRPMDRLLLGDVGFGKTEIAVRAAFKAIQSNRQVAVLAPTTILVQQHLNTFRSRMAEYPVIVEALSRFRSPAEQRQIISGLRNGSIDIVIGTHRLLSNDVTFRRLGLLIVDEEHRFGVRHKERLKKLREEVDVLTLTATPIPRTLHLALSGARALSKIETPPADRVPILTEIVPFDKGVIREAIMNELSRGGQVFFVHNRIRSIEAIRNMLMRVVPEASYGIGHGQMSTKDLEKVMLDFMEKRIDVLVCTMIVESGIDLPNVNTMVINRADKMGLAQLYQLRGRIGRSDKQAYAYMLIPPKKSLTKEARSRLETIAQFTELGAGFQVALRDLEIRGAGNLLGAEQSGFVNSVGFDLYSRLLEEAMLEARSDWNHKIGKVFNERENLNRSDDDFRVEFAGDAFIPDDYIPDEEMRVNFYRKLSNSGTVEEIIKLYGEMVDRFGRTPQELNNLFSLLRLKILAKESGAIGLAVKMNSLRLDYDLNGDSYRKLIERAVLSAHGENLEFSNDPNFAIKLSFDDVEDYEPPLNKMEEFVKSIIT